MKRALHDNDLLEAANEALGALATACACVGVAVGLAALLYVCWRIGSGA
jgi:hypothetical protein